MEFSQICPGSLVVAAAAVAVVVVVVVVVDIVLKAYSANVLDFLEFRGTVLKTSRYRRRNKKTKGVWTHGGRNDYSS